MPDASTEQYLYLTTTGRRTGRAREIEIWFVERGGRYYILAEHGLKARWVQNILAQPEVAVKLAAGHWRAVGRVVDSTTEAELYSDVRRLSAEKYGWGDGLPVELRLEAPLNPDGS